MSNQIGKNQLDTSLDALKAVNTGGTWNGNICTYSVGTVTVNADGTLTVKKTSTASRLLFYLTKNDGSSTPLSGTKYAGYILSGCPSGGSNDTFGMNGEQSVSPWGGVAADFGNGYTIQSSALPVYFYLTLKDTYTTPSDGITFKPMICTAEAWEISHEFEPYALTNHDLTVLEAEDRAGLVDVVDSGAKNFIKCFDTYSITEVTQTSSNGVVSATWAAIGSSNVYCRINEDLTLQPGTYIITGMQESNVAYYLHLEANGSTVVNVETATAAEFTVTNASAVYRLFIGVKANSAAQTTPKTIKPMICTKAAFSVSPKFVPYRMPYTKLGSLTYVDKRIALNTITFSKGGQGDYYWLDTITGFSRMLSISIIDFIGIPNHAFVPFIDETNPTNFRYGLLVCAPASPETLSYDQGSITVRIVGFTN